jgi:hypothetical protein
MDAFRAKVQTMPAGPGRDAAMQRMQETEANMRLSMSKDVTGQTMSGLSGIIAPELGYVGNERDRELQRMLVVGGLENQRYGMNLNYNLGNRTLGMQQQQQAWEQGTRFPWQTGQAAAELANSRWGTEYANQQAQQQGQSSGLGEVGGALLSQGLNYWQNRQNQGGGATAPAPNAGSGGFHISDIRMKEDIQPGRRGLSDLMKLRTSTFNYKGTPERKTQSVMAQDLEKVAPEFVKEFDGIKMVDSYGLLGMTMKAVQDLAKKMEKK